MPTEKDLNITAVYVQCTVTKHYSGQLLLSLPKGASATEVQRATHSACQLWEDKLFEEDTTRLVHVAHIKGTDND